MNTKDRYKVWLVYESEASKGSNFMVMKYYVVSAQGQVQSSWNSLSGANQACKDLNSHIKRQEALERMYRSWYEC